MGFRFSLSSVIFFVLSLAYLGGEFAFNAMMLDVAGSINSSPDEIERVKDFGRLISASGFTLLALGLFTRANFRLSSWREWALFFAVFAFCLIPFFVNMASENSPAGGEAYMTFLPFLGLCLAIISGGWVRAYLIVAIVLMSWPAVYAGQKILIESRAVDTTTWQERADARNVLMLRASLEKCAVDLGDNWLCGDGKASAGLRAARAVITAIWMHSPHRVIEDLGDKRDKIVEDIALKGMWFSPQKMYSGYVDKVTQEYRRNEAEMTEKFYVPYKNASDLYLASMDETALQKEADALWTASEAEIDKGWEEYKQGVKKYRSAFANAREEALRAVAPAARLADKYCAERTCADMPDAAAMIEKARKKARREFVKASGGYPPDIASRQDFTAHPKTKEKIRIAFEKTAREKSGDEAFALPQDWKYEEAAFKDTVKEIIRTKAKAAWDKNTEGKNVKPGLPREEFFKAISDEPIPALGDIIMSEDDFVKNHLLPKNREVVDSALQEMQAEAPLYANGQMLEEKGKDYIRAAYVPALALIISLVIVLLTLVRGLAAVLVMLEDRRKFFPDHPPGVMRAGVMGIVVMLLMFGPYIVPNAYTSTSAYKKYLGFAHDRNVVTAALLDWTIHMQPLLYGTGSAIRAAGEKVGNSGGK